MKLTNDAEVAVYTVSGASTARPLPDWLIRQRKKSLKKNPEFAHRVELLQDFEFEEASNSIRVSQDGNWIMSTGTYKPQFHVHNLPQLSLSFSRHTESLNVTFQFLSSDYSKSIHLQTDRRLELHTPMGMHYALRLPRYGRDLQYNRNAAEALVTAVGLDADGHGEVFRLNLEEGRFMSSYHVDVGPDFESKNSRQGSINVGSVNCASIAETTHNLLAFGTSKGTIEFWDPRVRARVATLGCLESEVTALEFAPSGLTIATGTSTGMVQIFDLRRPAPILARDQGYGQPIKKIIHITTSSEERKILSADQKVIKIWDQSTAESWTSIEPTVDINDVAWCRKTGMLLTANEGKQQHAFFIPQLGQAPSWCSFLDNMVEEMAEQHSSETYDNYKFLTVPELKNLSLDHLIGKTSLLRPYMHGFFVANRLHEEARLISNPFVYEEARAQRIQERVEKERASRIRSSKTGLSNRRKNNKLAVSQNQKLVDSLEEKERTKGGASDGRFGKFFIDERFVVDETSREYKAQYPNEKMRKAIAHMEEESEEEERVRNGRPGGEKEDVDAKSVDHEHVVSGHDRPHRNVDRRDANGHFNMEVSSSFSGGAKGRSKDASFASRVKMSSRAGRERARKGKVLGGQEMSFVPSEKKRTKDGNKERSKDGISIGAGKKNMKENGDGDEAEERWGGRKKRRIQGRRSASGNVLRRL